jgi:hypothetical protein
LNIKAADPQTKLAVNRAVANLLRIAEADLKDAELLSSGRNPGNAPALLHLAVDRLVQAVIATERGWPVGSDGRDDLDLVPDENPLKPMLASATRSGSSSGPPAVQKDGSAPVLPDRQKLREGILAAKALLKNLAARFEVDLFGGGIAGRATPIPPEPAPIPKPAPAAIKAKPPRAPVAAGIQQAVPPEPTKRQLPQPVALPPVRPKRPPPSESDDIEGRTPIETKSAPNSTASTSFWLLMDRWSIPDIPALELIGHLGGLTKKGTRPRFRLVGEEVDMLRGLQEIDAALVPLQLDPRDWLDQPLKAEPFGGATPMVYLTRTRLKGIRDTIRYILQIGLELSMSASGKSGAC